MLIIDPGWNGERRRFRVLKLGARNREELIATVAQTPLGTWRVNGGMDYPTAESAVRANWRAGDVRNAILHGIRETA